MPLPLRGYGDLGVILMERDSEGDVCHQLIMSAQMGVVALGGHMRTGRTNSPRPGASSPEFTCGNPLPGGLRVPRLD